MNYVKIPKQYKVGGQLMEVKHVESCIDNCLGTCSTAQGFIEIADKFGPNTLQSETSKENTFYHEVTHSILRMMGETELDNNEKFVCTFSSFLTEVMEKAYFKDDD